MHEKYRLEGFYHLIDFGTWHWEEHVHGFRAVQFHFYLLIACVVHSIRVAKYFVWEGIEETEACFALLHFLAESFNDQERGAGVKVREDGVLDGERDGRGRVDADDKIPASGGEEVSVKT